MRIEMELDSKTLEKVFKDYYNITEPLLITFTGGVINPLKVYIKYWK